MNTYSLVAFLILVVVGRQSPRQPTLDCSAVLGQEQAKEAPFWNQAPHGVRRPTKHRLVVNWSKGQHAFVDEAPYVESSLEGSRHLYCGYDPNVRFHLIYRMDEGISGGILLDDVTGKTLPAGERVFFDGNHQRYLAELQPNGLDGKEWRVYTRAGRQTWKGISYACYGKDVCTALDAPRWTASGELQADAVCGGESDSNRPRTPVILRSMDKRSVWLPKVTCKD